ncbi:hypothetical protein chiPu_0011052 [Chiloscyllium punctatum]|uniref:Uncharacterized protein n=1 Tax=Chiloscyllium punctatum TaxID=137246 RepID=A0A401SQA2_CHIPU|nr:hypothetical protein [Chiloscyllium punctatum]
MRASVRSVSLPERRRRDRNLRPAVIPLPRPAPLRAVRLRRRRRGGPHAVTRNKVLFQSLQPVELRQAAVVLLYFQSSNMMKSASVEVTTVNKSKVLPLTDPRVFLDGNSTTRKPEVVQPESVGVSLYSTVGAEIQCVGVLSYQLGAYYFGVMFENPVVVGELCQMLGLYVTMDPRERDELYAIIKSRDPSTVLQHLALFGPDQEQGISVNLNNVQISATMTQGTDCRVKVIVNHASA